MVEVLYTREQFKQVFDDVRNGKAFGVCLTKTHEQVEKLKETGFFRHLKNELSDIHTIKFACTKNDKVCRYYIFAKTEAMKMRVYNLLKSYCEYGKFIRLVDCSNFDGSSDIFTQGKNPSQALSETVSFCSLF